MVSGHEIGTPPSRGLFCDCEIFANLRLTFNSSSIAYWISVVGFNLNFLNNVSFPENGIPMSRSVNIQH